MVRQMQAIRNSDKPTPRTNDNDICPLAIYKVRDGYSGENADRNWSKNLYAHFDRLFQQMGRSKVFHQLRDTKVKNLIWKNVICIFGVMS